MQALGVGRADVEPSSRRNNASIQEAIDQAQAVALPRALRAAGERAAELARLSGLTRGEPEVHASVTVTYAATCAGRRGDIRGRR